MVKKSMGSQQLARLKDELPLELAPPAPAPELTPAGVLVPLFLQDDALQVLFTQRTLMVKDHRGQIAFPGGVRDPEDQHLLATALRETFEEIGLAPEAVEVLGTLPGVATITGYHITPYVGLIPHPYDFHTSPREVKRLLPLPLAGFYAPERWSSGPYIFQGRTTRVCYWHNGQEVVWGATARILLHLLAHLGAYPIPGDHDATCLD
ncbi:MAG: CoA pyrophosphatase [Syntrophobacterales bacterium]|nr:CoA pyrophosphatase [Syntrophobacterales bacterium]